MKPTLKSIQEQTQGYFFQWKKAAKELFETGYYVRWRNNNPVDWWLPYHCDVYFLDEKWEIETLCYNTTRHRACNLRAAHQKWLLKNINQDVVENYKNNGYMTRRGLFANYDGTTERIKKIARSHADYAWQETGDSTTDHNARVEMRR